MPISWITCHINFLKEEEEEEEWEEEEGRRGEEEERGGGGICKVGTVEISLFNFLLFNVFVDFLNN